MPEARQGKKKSAIKKKKRKNNSKYYIQNKEVIISGDFITTSLWLYKKIVSKVYATKFY